MKRPRILANFATSWDGRVSTRKRTPADFSSPADKRRLLEIRALGDAVLVAHGTAKADRMTMGLPDEKLRAERVARGQCAWPLRVLVSDAGRIDPALRLFGETSSPLVIYSTTRMPKRTQSALAPHAALHLHDGAQVDLLAMLAHLWGHYGVKKMVCEGGPTLFRALLALGAMDELFLTLCPRIFGGKDAPTITGAAGDFFPRSTQLRLLSAVPRGGECFLHYRIRR